MRTSRSPARALLAVLTLAGTFALVGDHRFPGPAPIPGPPRNAPRVVVAMGDSTISGEGAGGYEPGTNGERGNWCHRSTSASVHQIGVPGVDGTINLACSGASTAQVGLGEATQYTEPSQAARLAEIAARNHVVAVVVAAGANDEPAFSHVLDGCVQAWFNGGRRACSATVAGEWQRRVDAMVPKLVRALTDIKSALHSAGYRPHDYQIILQSYAAPVGPDILRDLQDLSGCPLRSEDLRWIKQDAVPALTAGLRRAAREADVHFLDLSRAGVGREACSTPDANREWFRRLVVQWSDLHNEERATHALQESFHPNEKGHAQFGRCLGEFLTTPAPTAACLAGADGNLHAATTVSPE